MYIKKQNKSSLGNTTEDTTNAHTPNKGTTR